MKDMKISVWGSDSGFMILVHSKKWQGSEDTARTNGESVHKRKQLIFVHFDDNLFNFYLSKEVKKPIV